MKKILLILFSTVSLFGSHNNKKPNNKIKSKESSKEVCLKKKYTREIYLKELIKRNVILSKFSKKNTESQLPKPINDKENPYNKKNK